jgi:outer membrane protein assembly factor BamD (BamD/ComL family)
MGVAWLVLASDDPGAPQPDPAPPPGSPRAVIQRLVPSLAQDLVLELQEANWDAALARIETRLAQPDTTADDRAFLQLLRGTTLRMAGRLDDARKALAADLEQLPKDSPWKSKLRSELMAVEVAAGQFQKAESFARVEVERLLAADRKDGFADVYLTFARRLLEPSEPSAQPDPEAAYALLAQARDLAQSQTTRARVQLMMGEASQKAGNHGRAIEDFKAYLQNFTQGADRIRARFLLGQSELASGQPLPARLTWSDLVRDLDKSDNPGEIDLRSRAQFEISRTYGFPAPGDDNSLALGSAALKRVLDRTPAHPLAVNAAFELGAAAMHRGRSQAAVEAFQAFIDGKGYQLATDAARRDHARLLMDASFRIAQVYQGQGRFDDAINAFQNYLAKFPNGPQSADAQRLILDTQLLIAQDHLKNERYDEARKAMLDFAAANPLDARVPQVLFDVGQSHFTQKKFDEAITAWETLAGKFPQSEPAEHALFAIAATFEVEKADPVEAVERFKKVTVDPWAAQARARIAAMEARNLTVVTPRAFRLGETPHLEITTRNLEKLTFTAYRLDAETYFRKKQNLQGVENLDIGLVAADAEWSEPVPNYGKYKPIVTKFELKKLESPAVYVVKVTDDRSLQATTLVISSNIDAIVKASRDQLLVFVQDMKSGKGVPNARVLVTDPAGAILDLKTGADGVLLQPWAKPRDPGHALQYLVLEGGHAAGSGLLLPGQVAQSLTPRAYIATERPAYRPGQTVEIRGILREVEEGKYAARPGAEYRLEVNDNRGRVLLAKPVKLSEFGTFHESLRLDSGTPVGTYRIRVYQPGKSDFAGTFEVQAYQLQKVDLAIELPRTVYFRGETLEGKVIARYQYGTPLAGRAVEVALPDGRTVAGTTDPNGIFAFSLDTNSFGEEQNLGIVARLPEEGVQAQALARLAVRAFSIDLATSRTVFLDGESFPLKVTTIDALGKPTGETISIAVLKQVERAGQVSEREVSRHEARTDPKSGITSIPLKVADARGGRFILRASGTDRFGNPILRDHVLTISGQDDPERLRILADRTSFKVGENAQVRLFSRDPLGPVLLAWEADRILQYRLMDVKEGENPLDWPVSGAEFPNFTLTATRMVDTKLRKAALDLAVTRELVVEIKPAKETVLPGEDFDVEITTLDQLGKPVPAEIALAMVDEALLRLFPAPQPIGPFFYNQSRTGAFTTESTNTFRYQPATQPVAEAVVEELERGIAAEAAIAQRADALEAAGRVSNALSQEEFRRQVAGRPGSAAQSARGRAFGGRGGMGGGMGGMPVQAAPGAPTMPAPMDAQSAAADRDQAQFEEMADMPADARGEKSKDLGLLLKRSRSDLKAGEAFFGYQTLSTRTAGDQDGAEEPARQQYVETAYWNPAVVTGPDGKARVKIQAPLALSKYRFTARGVTGADTLVGETTANISVNKDFFVELKLPAYLLEGDQPRMMARLHHTGVPSPAEVLLKIYAGGKEQVLPKKLEWKADGVEEILFDPVPIASGDVVRFTLTATAQNARDQLLAEIPLRPWGIQAFASASGSSSNDAASFLALPEGRNYTDPEMVIVLSPSQERMIIELALGHSAIPIDWLAQRCLPPPDNSVANRAGELIAASAALRYVKSIENNAAPEAERLANRIRGLVSELVVAQNEEGGWPWINSRDENQRGTHVLTSARALWALSDAEKLGFPVDPQILEKAVAYLTAAFARVEASDPESRAAVLHALSVRGKATFEQANSLNRLRQGLSDVGLACLALVFVNLDRASLAGEVLDVLGPRAKSEIPAPGEKPRIYWDGRSTNPWNRSTAETTALAALAYALARPADSRLEGAVAWLEAHRIGTGWRPAKAKGPALAALARFYDKARPATERYRLAIKVNDETVYESPQNASPAGQAIRVPARALKPAGENRVAFDIEGRGSYSYAITLTGFTREFAPDQNHENRAVLIGDKNFLAAAPEQNGKPLPTGFGVAVNPTEFVNKVTQSTLGGRTIVKLDAHRIQHQGQQPWEQDFLIVEDHLPAGAILVEGSVSSQAVDYDLVDGLLTFYFAPGQYPGRIQYELLGALPGDYRTLPPRIRSAYEPGRLHLGAEGKLKVLIPGEKSTDPYKPTPDELFARGKMLFDEGRLEEAAPHLEALWSAYTLRDDVARDAARMLLNIHIKNYDPRKVVAYFEVLKEKAPELVIPFDKIQVVGRAYTDIQEFERAFLVWRATAEASYLEDAKVGESLRQRAQTFEGLAFLLNLWREYPSTAAIDSDFYGLSQALGALAGPAVNDPAIRRQAAAAGLTRSSILAASIQLNRAFLALSPKDPLSDEASLALLGSYLELEDFKSVVELAQRYANLFKKSRFLDSFQYSEALGRFNLGEYDRAVELAERIASATYQDPSGAEQPSPNKWEAVYILGQIFDARRQPEKALAYYKQVEDRFGDAAGAVKELQRKALVLPELTVVRPKNPHGLAGGAGLRSLDLQPPVVDKPEISLNYRNIPQVDVKVYPVDLLRLYLTRRNLDQISGIDLAGIKPLVETNLQLESGADFNDHVRKIDLPVTREGAYLVMVRGEELYASGIVLVSPLELEVLEEPDASRVRVRVLDARTRAFVPKVQVKVIGSNNPNFISGETDLRGIFVAEGVNGQVTAVVRAGKDQYAFHRGKTFLGPPPVPGIVPQTPEPGANAPVAAPLGQNVQMQNSMNRESQLRRLEERYKEMPKGVQVDKAR